MFVYFLYERTINRGELMYGNNVKTGKFTAQALLKMLWKGKIMVWLFSIFIACIDQFIKRNVELKMYDKEIAIIEDIFSVTYVENRGAAWGLLSGYPLILNCLTLLILVAIIIYFRKLKGYESFLGALIIGGATGNYIDRIFRGYVVDYIDFKVWPVFNFADICIVMGCILLCMSLYKKSS